MRFAERRAIGLVLVALVSCALLACDKRPSDAQLDALRKEAQTENDKAAQAYAAKKGGDNTWSVTVSGMIKDGKKRLDWQTLQVMATTHVKTRAPHRTQNPQEVVDWRGVNLGTMLDQLGTSPDAKTLTFICADQYSVQIQVADTHAYPIILALEESGKPIKRSDAGPVLVVYPYTSNPDIEKKYDETNWAFYVTDVIVDHEAPSVRFGQKTLDAAALGALPRGTIAGKTGFKIHWDETPTKLSGPRLTDALAAAGMELPPKGVLHVRSKPPPLASDQHELAVDVDDVRSCGMILATKYGDDDAPIPTFLSGPVGLAFGDACKQKYDKAPWPSYVEEIDVEATSYGGSKDEAPKGDAQ
jgi:hypothetical protein